MTKIIENTKAEVQNLIENVKNEVVEKSTTEIFEQMLQLEPVNDLAQLITTMIIVELRDASFMTEDLELTEKQKEKLLTTIEVITQRAKNQYLAAVDKDEKTRKVSGIVQVNLKAIIEEMLSSLAKEVNRGALINCQAVSADTKSDKYNKIELHSYKTAGNVTIPTRGLFISTNCLDIIKTTVDATLGVEGEEEEKE